MHATSRMAVATNSTLLVSLQIWNCLAASWAPKLATFILVATSLMKIEHCPVCFVLMSLSLLLEH